MLPHRHLLSAKHGVALHLALKTTASHSSQRLGGFKDLKTVVLGHLLVGLEISFQRFLVRQGPVDYHIEYTTPAQSPRGTGYELAAQVDHPGLPLVEGRIHHDKIVLLTGKIAYNIGPVVAYGETRLNILKQKLSSSQGHVFIFKKIETVDGKLRVDPAPLTIWTAGATKVYDGTPLTDPETQLRTVPANMRIPDERD